MRYLYQAVRGGDNDGLLQRFQLLVYPDESAKWRLVDREPDNKEKQRAFFVIRTLAEMDFIKHGAAQTTEKSIPYFGFDEIAQEIFYNWHAKHEERLRKSDEHAVLQEHLAKYRSLLPSLALIFHLIELADGKQSQFIRFENVLDAVGWCGYLESHVRRIYGMATDMSQHASAMLAKKIEEGKLFSGFTVRDVYRKDWSLLNSKEIIRNACDELVDAGWLRQEVKQSNVGRPKQAAFIVNPKIKIKNTDVENSADTGG